MSSPGPEKKKRIRRSHSFDIKPEHKVSASADFGGEIPERRPRTTEEIQEYSANTVEDWLQDAQGMQRWVEELTDTQLSRFSDNWRSIVDTAERTKARALGVLGYLRAERQRRLQKAQETEEFADDEH